MHTCAMEQDITPAISSFENSQEQYSSVEISNQDFSFCYHFKLWNMAQKELCILVKEDSKILPQLKEGATYEMKYYRDENLPAAENKRTTIRDITKDDNGRFKGHYLVHLEITGH